MSEFTGLYDIRDFKTEDTNFVLATFYNGVFYGDNRFLGMAKKSFISTYKVLGERLIRDPNTVIKVACLKDEPDVILGYSILSADYLGIKWVFVKDRWRKRGIGKSLVPRYPVYVTHKTEIGNALMPKFENFATITFEPFKT